VDAEDVPGHLQPNPEVMRRYLPTRAPRISPEAVYFPEAKRPGSYRLVVQGGSTAAGFPYGRWAGLAGMLGDRLEATFPDHEIEVISTAMAAVNSYTLLDFVDEIIEIEPDAVLIYAGHNEYMGAMGVASGLTSTRSRRGTLLHLRLIRFRSYQLLQQLIAAGRGLLAGSGEQDAAHESLMTRAAKGVEIEYGSPLSEAGVTQFWGNLSLILERYQRAGIPVYVATLVSNERDQAPFSGGGSGDESADSWFARGRDAEQLGDPALAREAYRRARDLDRLPFRAPGRFNELLARAADGYGATLVDVQQRFAAASRDGIVGNELLLEHLHPNAEGYFLLADAFYEALRVDGAIGDWSQAPSREEAQHGMPITVVDRMLAEHAVRELKGDFPFSATRRVIAFPEPRDDFERIARELHAEEVGWLQAMERLMQLHRGRGEIRQAAVVARMAAQAFPTPAATNFTAGRLYMQLGELARARRYLDRSLAAQPDHAATLRALVRVNRSLGNDPLARAHLARLKQIAPLDPLVHSFEEAEP
jgi:tetratricopeptide (TPR) repeat protein